MPTTRVSRPGDSSGYQLFDSKRNSNVSAVGGRPFRSFISAFLEPLQKGNVKDATMDLPVSVLSLSFSLISFASAESHSCSTRCNEKFSHSER